MNPAAGERARLVDAAGEGGRTTATLVASLAARLATLHYVTGASAVGSLVAGFTALGREVSRTAEGARLRKALEAGRPGVNGPLLWDELRITDWISSAPPSPVLDQLRNDMALLLAGDLQETLELLPIPGDMAGSGAEADDEEVHALDCIVGLWAFSRELIRTVEALAAPTLPALGTVVPADPGPVEPDGSLLR